MNVLGWLLLLAEYNFQTANYTNCEAGGIDNLPGCGIIEWSQASYGPTFDAGGGGVFAMKWDVDGIAVCE